MFVSFCSQINDCSAANLLRNHQSVIRDTEIKTKNDLCRAMPHSFNIGSIFLVQHRLVMQLVITVINA